LIEGYVGLIGGGKSLNATDRMMRYMAAGGAVYTNMTLVRPPWYNLRYAHLMKEFRLPRIPEGVVQIVGGSYYVFDGELALAVVRGGFAYANSCGFEAYLRDTYRWRYQEGQYTRLSNDDLTGELHGLIPRGTPSKPVLCVLDEAVDFFDTDDRATANREFLSFLRHSRKQCVDMIFIAQDFTELNKRIRNQTHFIWTFWDMQTFRIPGLRSTLPPPWRNMILCQQWNRNMTGGPLKRIWKTRDQGLFGCYRTDELFRSLKSADGKTDFSGEGNIVKGGFKMKPLERIALFLCLLFTGLQLFGGGGGEGNAKEGPAVAMQAPALSAKEPEEPLVQVTYGRFRYHEKNGNVERVNVDGIDYWPGQQTTAGVVLAVASRSVHIMDGRGRSTFIYPDYSYRFQVPREWGSAEQSHDGTSRSVATTVSGVDDPPSS